MPVARSPAPRMTTSIRSLFSVLEMVWSDHGAGVMSRVLPAAGPLIDHFPGDAHGDLRRGHGLDGCSHRGVDSAANPDDVSSIIQYAGAKKAFTVNIGSFEFSWFMLITALLLVASYVLLYKTRFGLRLMACGEHPQAADSVGINVYKMRWAGVLISGFLGGLGGIVFITAGVSEWRFEYGVAGFGFLSLAVMIFGQWKPQRIALAALLFGFFRALGNVYTGFAFLKVMNLPSSVYNMLPYIISLIVLAFTSKNSRAPKAEGIPYDKGQR